MSLPVAVQIFSVRDDAARNLRETLSAIKQMEKDENKIATKIMTIIIFLSIVLTSFVIC